MHAMDRIPAVARLGAVVTSLLLFAGIGLGASGRVGLVRQAWGQSRGQTAAPAAPKLIVSDVIIQGNRQMTTETIRGLLKTRPGQEYDAQTVGEDVRTLYGTKQLANVASDMRLDPDGRARVFFIIRDYPSVIEKLEYRGAYAIKRDDLDSLTGLRKGMPLNPLACRVACTRIVGKYNEEGYPLASCTLLKGSQPEDTEVIFNVTEGHKVRVTDVRFAGNTFVSAERLRTQVNVSDGLLRAGLIGTPYNLALIENDVNELIKYYRNFGYHDVRVGRSIRFTPDARGMVVTFHIDEGVRYHIQNLPEVHGSKSVPREPLEAGTLYKTGDPFDQSKTDRDTKWIESYLGYGGTKATVRADLVYPQNTPGLVAVNYQVDEQPPSRVGEIFIVGNDRTRQNVILRQLPLFPGQLLTYPDLAQSEKNLARLGIFSGAEGSRPKVEVIDDPNDRDSPYKRVLVTVQEDNTGSLMFGLGVNSDSGLTGSIVLNERNFDLFHPPTTLDDLFNGTAFRGAGQEFRLEAVPGTVLQRYTASLREPFLFDSPYSLTTSGYYYQRYYNEYSEERIGGRVTLGRKINDFWSVSAGVRLENVNVNSVAAGAPSDYTNVIGDNFLLGAQVGVTRDTRDNYMRATDGSLTTLTYEQVTGTYDFPLVNFDYSKYITTYQRADGSGKQVLALHSAVGYAGDNTPVYERYFGGGFRSIRGFQFRGVGPEVNGFKVGGDFQFLNSIEYQVPVRAADNIFLVGFIDSGVVSSKISTVDDYRVSAGFGIRFVVPMLGPVPIALDFAFPIARAPQDNTQVFNFYMGFNGGAR